MEGTTIDKIAWIYITDRKVLFLRSRGKDVPYTPGGKREQGESDEQALIREIQEEVGVTLIPDTIRPLHTIVAQAHGKPQGTMVQIACYTAGFVGTLAPAHEIEEMQWVSTADFARLSEPGKILVTWLNERDLID